MKNYVSTRGGAEASIDEAIVQGLASDGGLYIPRQFPDLQWQDFIDFPDLASFAASLIGPFFTDSQLLVDEVFCQQIFSFPMPVHALNDQHYVLELFHGPTLSFKDFGARFFAHCLETLAREQPYAVLVATSGDTGSAVAAALHDKQNIRTFILYPFQQISARQEAQITGWGGRVQALAVRGSFDDCQALVKAAFADPAFNHRLHLTTANSINIARLLPQVLFYAHTAVQLFKKHTDRINFIVPSGNLGNVTACYWARRLGFPIGEIKIANNANHVLSDYLESGHYEPRAALKTLANAMDVGNPSNLERLMALYPQFSEFKQAVQAESVSDEAIKAAIVDCYRRYDYLICPHTATAYDCLSRQKDTHPWVIVGTAHPAKFEQVIEPLLNIQIPIPIALQSLMMSQPQVQVINPDLTELPL